MRTLLFLLLMLSPATAYAQPVAQNLNINSWLRQVQALPDDAEQAVSRRLALQLDPELQAVCETTELTTWVIAQRVDKSSMLVQLGCGYGAREPISAPYALQLVRGQWLARRLRLEVYSRRTGLGLEATFMGDLTVTPQFIEFSTVSSDGSWSKTSTYRLPRLSEPPRLVLLRAEETEDGYRRVLYTRRSGR